MGLTLNGKKVLDRTLLYAQEFVLDADGDSSLTADTDDQLDLRLGGTDIFVFKTTGLDIGAVTNAILVSGTTTSAFKIDADATTGLEITSNCTPTDGIIIAGSTARGINISGAASSAQLYIGGADILANGEQAIYVNCPSEDGATNAAWFTLGSTVTSGDVTGLRSRVTGNAASGGANIRGAYSEAFCGASKHVATLQGLLAHASVAAGTCTVATTQVIYGIFGTGDSFTGTDVYVGYLKAQTRGTETIGGNYCLLGLENEAVGGVGKQMDSAIRIFATNVSTPYAFGYGIDLSGATGEIATADIRLSNGETIDNTTNGTLNLTATTIKATGAFNATGAVTLDSTLSVGSNVTLNSGSDIRPSADATNAINIANAAGTDFVTFDTTNSRMGIGTTEPQYLADYGSATAGGRDIGWAAAATHKYAAVGTLNSGAALFLGRLVESDSAAANRLNYSSAAGVSKSSITLGADGIIFSTKAAAAETIGNQFDWATTYARMIVTSAGNVGIGTTSPATDLDVAGYIYSNGKSVAVQTGDVLYIGAAEAGGEGAATTQIRANDATAITILSSGNVGIATTVPGQILDVNQGSGNMIADGYDTHSERRFKKNIIELAAGDYATIFDQLDTLKLYRYQLKHDHKERPHLGILADDPTTPSILKGTSDKYQSLSLGDIIMFLVATVKGLNHRVKILEGGI